MRILITAGGTREYIDPVRFISNASSGRMGYALARAALKAEHTVTLITAPTSLRIPNGVKVIRIETAAQMFEAVKKHFRRCDCLIMAAAVADYTPVHPAKTKIKKTGQSMTLQLKPTPDILKWTGRHKKKSQIIVGFALEDNALQTRAEKKMKDKNLDIIVANSPETIAATNAVVEIKTRHGNWKPVEKSSKDKIAKRIIALCSRGK